MAKSNFIAFLLMGSAVFGMGVWMFQISRERASDDAITEVRGDETPARVAAGSSDRVDQRLDNLEGLLEQYREDSKRLDALEEKVAAIEAGRTPVAVVEGGGTPVAVASPDLERSVEAIMAKKEEERQKAEQQRRVERMAGFFLRDVNATPEQQKKFVEIIAAYWDERRKTFSDQDTYSTPEARQAANEQLSADRDLKLQQIFDAAQMTQVTERLDRMGRGMGGGGGGRGNRTGGRNPGGGR